MKQWEIHRGSIAAPWWYKEGYGADPNGVRVSYCLGTVDGRIGWLDFAPDGNNAESPPDRMLQKPFETVDGDAPIEDFEHAIATYTTSPRAALQNLPLILFGTDWQRKVWKELLSIPCGSVRTYAEVARRLGKPGAARAVGGAARANPILLLVPCHRLIATGGGLGGYAEGIERKRSLLEHEKLIAR